MNKDTFNFRRFGKYFASDVKTCTANFGLSLITVSLLFFLFVYALTIAFGIIFSQVWDGPGLALRVPTAVAALTCIVVVMPVKAYGKLTEKQYGAQWLMIPASRLEKFLSMIILSCIIVPIVGITLYLGIDALFCAVDHTCGTSIIRGLIDLEATIDTSIQEVNTELGELTENNVANFITQMTNPWLHIDDCFGMVLPFLLGALMFKSGKTVKTILALVALSAAVSMISTPLMKDWADSMMEMTNSGNMELYDVRSIYNSWIFRNITLVDTISDTIFNLGLLTAIFFRIKTLKH